MFRRGLVAAGQHDYANFALGGGNLLILLLGFQLHRRWGGRSASRWWASPASGRGMPISHKQVSNVDGYRKTEWTLIEGETIYAIGEHATLGGPNAVLDKQADLSTLLARFDRNRNRNRDGDGDGDGDGDISLEEWGAARKAASDEIDRSHLDIRLADGIRLLRKPPHGRPFLIANREVTALVRHFRLWSWAHLAIMLASLFGLMILSRML